MKQAVKDTHFLKPDRGILKKKKKKKIVACQVYCTASVIYSLLGIKVHS